MKTWQSMLVGIVIGLILFIIVAFSLVLNVKSSVVENYQDEVEMVHTLLENSKEGVVQPYYILAGLNLSHDFQEYLQQEVENGLWNQEYIIQVLTDGLIPIYEKQYKATIKAVIQTDKVQDLKDKLESLKAKISSINFGLIIGNIKAKIYGVLNGVSNVAGNIGTVITQVKSAPATIKELLRDIKNDIVQIIDDLPDDIKDQIINSDVYKNIIKTINKLIDTANDVLGDITQEIQNILSQVEDILNILEETGSYLLEDVDKDFNFNLIADANGQVNFSDDFSISAKILNALNLNINYIYDNNGTPAKPSDDELEVTSIYITFENLGSDLYIGTNKLNIKVKGEDCLTIKIALDTINKQV